MKKYLIIVIIMLFMVEFANSQWTEKGDTLVVQTLNYDSITSRSGTWQFPPKDDYEKILMHYSLKCDPQTKQDGFECGEWDYLTYTVVTDSSGQFDSTKITNPNYLVRGSTPNKYYYTTEPYNYKEQESIFKTSFGDGLESRTEYAFNWDESNRMEAVLENSNTFYTDFFYKQEDIIEMKKDIDEINAIKLKFLEDVKINNFNITIFKTNINAIGAQRYEEEILYLDDIEVDKGEEREFILFNGVKLDEDYGIKVVLAGEVTEGTFAVRAADNQNAFNAGMDRGAQNYIKFNRGSYIDVPGKAFDNISSGITIAFWQYGDKINMPQNSYAFEGVNFKGQRVLNSHLPWSNGSIYWDAGNSGGSYDRVQKEATEDLYKGKWNHWAFTKDFQNGTMKIFLNGTEWASAEEKSFTFEKIEKFKIASNANGYGRYDGSMDNFAVWNRVISENEIDASMNLDFQTNKDATIWNGLQLCYDMNNNLGKEVIDISGNGFNGTIHGFPEYRNINAKNILVSENRELLARPSVKFVQANFPSSAIVQKVKTDILREYPMPKDELLLFEYNSPNRVIVAEDLEATALKFSTPTEILEVYPANIPIFVYNNFGFKIDSVKAIATDSIIKSEFTYYSPIVDYEIHRFITPYGINLDLGPDGFTWVEDVTDFTPILHDYVKLRAGNQQELIDIKFLFIKGTPTRNVRSVQQLWGSGGTFEAIVNNDAIAPRGITPFKGSNNFRLLTRSSGHGFDGPSNTGNCSEFCNRKHSFWLNQEKLFEWNGWKECGDNPVFPQGGTWQIDRSDWCPGATVNTYVNELTGILPLGIESEIEYDILNPVGFVPYGNYIFTSYLIGYEEPNFTTDASIERIIRPSMEQEFGRLNPICGTPEILVKNNGIDAITEIEFEYGIVGFEKSTFKWSGNIEFLDSKALTLPALNSNGMRSGNEYNFEIRILTANGKEDEYSNNNFAVSKLQGTDVLAKKVSITLRTNNQAEAQYRMTLKNSIGEVIDEKQVGEFESNKTYQLDYDLELGCYELFFENVEGYGLDLWWIRDQLGTGYIYLSSLSRTINFNPDFGNFIKYQFKVANKPEIQVSADTINFGVIDVGEKVTKSIFIEPKNSEGLYLKSIKISLGSIKGMKVEQPEEITEDIFIPYGAKYEIKVSFEPKDDKPKFSNLIISTNAENFNGYIVALIGNYEISSVESEPEIEFGAKIIENSSGKRLEIVNKTNSSKKLSVNLYEINGKFVKNLLKDKIVSNQTILPINVTNLQSGIYIVRIEMGEKLKDLKFININ